MQYSPEVAEALERSIRHWRENRDASVDSVSVSSSDCALCCLFNQPHIPYSDLCWGCPVTGGSSSRRLCENTPYDDVNEAYAQLCSDPDDRSLWHSVCDREIAFLESLRGDVPDASGATGGC